MNEAPTVSPMAGAEPSNGTPPQNLPPKIPADSLPPQSSTEPNTPPPEQPSSENPVAAEAVSAESKPKLPNLGGRRRPDSPQMIAWKERTERKELAEADPRGIYELDVDRVVKYRDRMGLTKREWGRRAKKVMKGNFDLLLAAPVLAQVSLVDAMDSAEQVKMVQDFCSNIAMGKKIVDGVLKDVEIRDEEKIKATLAVAECHRTLVEKTLDIIKIAEMAGGGVAKPSDKPKNKPPQLGIEMTSKDGTTARVVATSGETP